MTYRVAIIGAGPAGLMAADVLSAAGATVTIHDRMPSPGRKFLMAGRGGLNLTHSEPLDRFLPRYSGSIDITRAVQDFSPDMLRSFARDLGEETFIGTSGRVFPKRFKSSPLLRAWLACLAARGVVLHTRETFLGLENGRPVIERADGERCRIDAHATVLALGGASWPRLGSNGAWVAPLEANGVAIAPLRPANCGIRIAWSSATREKFAGAPLKRMAFTCDATSARGEAVLTHDGLEGGAIYALSHAMSDALSRYCVTDLHIDLLPDASIDDIRMRLAKGRNRDSLSNMLRKRLSLSPVALALLRESRGGPLPRDIDAIAQRLKNVALRVTGTAALDRAISTAGGVHQDALDARLMLTSLPGIFVAGEMLDFDAPTGGYLLQACFATGVAAARGVLTWLDAKQP